jgi:hypothetical protein
MQDLTIIFYTANKLPELFAKKVQGQLMSAIGDIPLISVSFEPMDFGQNICVGDIGRHHLNIYRQALKGVTEAKTKFIALAEDDVLYHPTHFKRRPTPGKFAYNMNVWSIYTWENPQVFSYKNRRNLSGLICERKLFIEAMEERFARWPDDSRTPIRNWAEPGKSVYEKNLGVKQRLSEEFYSEEANVAFSHPTALSFLNLGTRKKLGNIKATAIPFWGSAEEIAKLYV